MSLRKTFKILYQKLRTAVGNTRRARFEESPLIHSKKIKDRINDCFSLETKFTIKDGRTTERKQTKKWR